MDETDGFVPYEAREVAPHGRPPRPATPGHLVGRVADSATRVESHGRDFGSETVLSFRLLGSDGQTPRDVELRGRSISGVVRDGDWVEVPERERSGRLEVAAVRNLTTGAEVETSGGSSTSPVARVIRVAFLLIFVLVFLFIIWNALAMFGVINGGWPFGDSSPLDGGI